MSAIRIIPNKPKSENADMVVQRTTDKPSVDTKKEPESIDITVDSIKKYNNDLEQNKEKFSALYTTLELNVSNVAKYIKTLHDIINKLNSRCDHLSDELIKSKKEHLALLNKMKK